MGAVVPLLLPFLALIGFCLLGLNGGGVTGFELTAPVRPHPSPVFTSSRRSAAGWPLFMGRAAAVRATTKAKTDMRKAKTNAIYGKKLVMAIKDGGGSTDPAANRQLAEVMKNAKANSVPVENINRILKKASEGVVGDFKELTYEAYGVGGASMIINVLTDNTNRANGDVRSTVTRRNGKMAEIGSVVFLYDRKGKVTVPTTTLDEEKLLEAAIGAGIDDYEVVVEGDEEGTTTIYTDVKEAALMLEAIQTLGFEDGLKLSLVHVSKAPVECSDEDFEKNMSIIDALEELDDVDSVEHNMDN
jgi:YebC/PmpR family DNA-binding regulatory protein